eukprot:8459805-Lingulodinium_polyedra.AAC.1
MVEALIQENARLENTTTVSTVRPMVRAHARTWAELSAARKACYEEEAKAYRAQSADSLAATTADIVDRVGEPRVKALKLAVEKPRTS